MESKVEGAAVGVPLVAELAEPPSVMVLYGELAVVLGAIVKGATEETDPEVLLEPVELVVAVLVALTGTVVALAELVGELNPVSDLVPFTSLEVLESIAVELALVEFVVAVAFPAMNSTSTRRASAKPNLIVSFKKSSIQLTRSNIKWLIGSVIMLSSESPGSF